jgi:hypothetical protein
LEEIHLKANATCLCGFRELCVERRGWRGIQKMRGEVQDGDDHPSARIALIVRSTSRSRVSRLGHRRAQDALYGVRLATIPMSKSLSTTVCADRFPTSKQTMPDESRWSIGV